MDELLTSNEIYNKFSNDVELEKYNNVLGTYNTDDFTIRLAYYIHEKLDHLNAGVINGSDIDDETLQAYSTFLHETIHWRQHIGSIAGFILSMKTPAQNFCLQHFLKIILEEIGPVKSLKKFYINNVKTNTPTDRLFQNLNNILNNFYDLKYYTYLVINPKIITDNINMHEDFFLTYGHSTVYAYINFLEIFSGYFREDQYINEKIKKLKNVIYTQEKSPHKEFNAFKKGQFVIPPIGLKQIFEGQARFIQLQFLYFANKKKFDMQFFHDTKLLTGVYGEAFDLYISIIGYDYPLSFGSHLISIFLVICDLAINPGVAFPLDVGHEESFFFEAIPGLRFYDLCHAAKELIAIDPKFTVCNHSKSEYYYIANTLCDKLCYNNPIEIIDEVLSWAQRYESIRNIQDEEKTYSFSKELLPIRFLLSKFILICEDKKNHPEFFCWTGACSAGENLKNEYILLTEKHKAPFINQKDLDVYASYHEGIGEDKIEAVKDYFTAMNIMSNLMKQWITEDGEFDVDFIKEISAKYNVDDLKKSYGALFKNHFGVDLDDFTLL